MAAKKQKAKDKKGSNKHYSDYPIKTLFQVCTLAGAITFVLSFVYNTDDPLDAVFRAFLVFAIVAIVGGLVIVTAVSIMAKMQEQKAEDMKLQIEREQKEFFESQLQLQEEMERVEGREKDNSNEAS